MARKNAYDKMDDLQGQVEHTLTRQVAWDQPVTHDATQYAGQNYVWSPPNIDYPEWRTAREEARWARERAEWEGEAGL
jgi:hypothetical protein